MIHGIRYLTVKILKIWKNAYPWFMSCSVSSSHIRTLMASPLRIQWNTSSILNEYDLEFFLDVHSIAARLHMDFDSLFFLGILRDTALISWFKERESFKVWFETILGWLWECQIVKNRQFWFLSFFDITLGSIRASASACFNMVGKTKLFLYKNCQKQKWRHIRKINN